SWSKSANANSGKLAQKARCKLALTWAPSGDWAKGEVPNSALRILLLQLRQRLRDHLLAVLHLGEEADAVDLAGLVPACLEQNTRHLVRRDRQAVQRVRNRLRLELASLLGGGFDHVGRDIAFHAVMVGLVIVLRLELLAELLERGHRRIDRQ